MQNLVSISKLHIYIVTCKGVNIPLVLLWQIQRLMVELIFGEGQGDIYIENVQCNGNESHLEECPSSDVGDHDCSHSEDAGVSCQGTGSMRLYCICMQDHFLCGLFLKHSICS